MRRYAICKLKNRLLTDKTSTHIIQRIVQSVDVSSYNMRSLAIFFCIFSLNFASDIEIDGCEGGGGEIFRCAKIRGEFTIGAIFPIRDYDNKYDGRHDFTICDGDLNPVNVLKSEAYSVPTLLAIMVCYNVVKNSQ